MEILKLDDLVGNALTLSLIKKGTRRKTLPQMILLSGVLGIGKSSSAELIAMALTCESPVDGEACRACDTCRKNILALKPGSTGVSPRLEKINMALVNEKKSMREFLTSTFQVVRSDGVYVKILEEFHQLSPEEQGLMLEETARLPDNIYLILTTTHNDRVLKEIESRCITFHFGKLNKGETMILVDKVNQRLKLKPEDYTLIYQKTGGIPRNIVLLVKFLSDSNPTPEEIDQLLGNINKEVFIDIFNNAWNFRLYLEIVNNLMAAYSADVILDKLNNFLIQVIFALEGEIYDYIPKKILDSLPFRDVTIVYKIIKLVEDTEPVEYRLQATFLKIRRLLAPSMTIHEQKVTADTNSSIKGIAVTETGHKLSRFKKE